MDNVEEQQLTKKQRKELKRQEKINQQEKSVRNKKIRNISIGIAIVIVIAGLGLVYYFSNKPPTPIASDDDPYLGGKDAKVVINEFSDFQCPACKSAAPIVRQLASEYGDKIKIIFNNFPLSSHPLSFKAAVAGECAFAQNKFWEFYDLLFSNEGDWENTSDPTSIFKDIAKKVGLDENTFSECLNSKATEDRVNYDIREGESRRVLATPTFFVNDQKIQGAASLDEFKKVVDEELNKN